MYSHLMPFSAATESSSRQEQHARIAAQRKAQAQPDNRKVVMQHQHNNGAIAQWPREDDEYDYHDFCDCEACTGIMGSCFPCVGAFGLGPEGMTSVGQRVEPKLFFANERTFIHWLHMGVTLSTVSVAVLAFGADGHISQYYALAMLPVSLLFCAYALYTFHWRAARIHDRINDRWDDPRGPLMLAVSLILALTFNFFIKVYALATENRAVAPTN
jgi:uncharacterized membrane protein YidH (DUF202 family)